MGINPVGLECIGAILKGLNMGIKFFKSNSLVFALFFFVLFLNLSSFLYISFQTRASISELSLKLEQGSHFNMLLDSLFNVDFAASDLNAPGNNIFESHDLKRENEHLIKAYSDFNKSIVELQNILSKSEATSVFPSASRIKELSDKIVKETKDIFDSIKKNDVRSAGKSMALMDQTYSVLRGQLTEIQRDWRERVAKIGNEEAEITHAMADSSATVLIANIFLTIALMAIGFFAYRRNKKSDQISDFYRKALDQSSIVAVTDNKGKITYANAAFSKISGYEISELIGKDHRVLNSKHHPKSYFTDLWKTISKGTPWHGEVKNRRKNGSYYWVDTTVVPMTDDNGKTSQYVAIRHDITERKEAEEKLVVARNHAERASRIKSEFLANMSHEIRTPMNAIIGMADLLDESPLNEEQKRYVSIFKRAGENLLSIINDILDISKIESGHLTIEKDDFNIRTLVEDITEICAPKAFAKKLDIVCHIDPSVPDFYSGDALRIRQVLMNLVGNSIKFTEKGSISIHLSQNVDSKKTGNILLAVSDTGIGISPENQERLFQAFAQADSSVTKKYGGTGLGLAISKKLTEMMGGEMWITSESGVGSTFSFTLNCEPAKTQPAVASATMNIDLKGKKMLVVDDREINRSILREILAPLGVEVVEEADCTAALETTREIYSRGNAIEVILIDYRFKDGPSGLEFVEKLKSESKYKSIPIILLSSDNIDVPRAQLYKMGVFSLIYKPVKRGDLIKEISRALGHTVDEKKVVVGLDQGNKLVMGASLNILLVDDSDDNRTLIKEYLKKTTHRITEVENGELAVAKFKENKFDIVLMDMQMPVLDGFSATKIIRSWESEKQLPPTPIIALTAYALKEEMEKCLAAGCDSHLSKPVKKQVLMNTLEKVNTLEKRKVA